MDGILNGASCPDTMREALPVVGGDARQNAPRVCDAHGHAVQGPKLTDGDGLNCDPAWLSRRDDDEGMSLVMIRGATRRWR